MGINSNHKKGDLTVIDIVYNVVRTLQKCIPVAMTGIEAVSGVRTICTKTISIGIFF